MKINLDDYPKTQDFNIWADFIEMKALVSEGSLSVDDIIDCITDENFGDREVFLDDYELDKDVMGSDVSQIEDKNIAKIKEYFIFASNRMLLYGDFYPFVVFNDHIQLKRPFHNKCYGYIFLLLTSNLKIFNGQFHKYTRKFEQLSMGVLRNIFSENTRIYYFGKGNLEIDSPFTQSSLYDNLEKLANMLNIALANHVSRKNIGTANSGDAGLDIIAYIDLKDHESGMPAFFVQCACGSNWENKQLEAHAINWDRYLQFQTKPQSYLMTPKSLRDYCGKWENPLRLKDVVFIDRLRFLNFLDEKMCTDQKDQINSIVNCGPWDSV